jgi:hypothetical protein
MSKIVLISCTKTKLQHKAKARCLYISPLFVKSLNYAENVLKPDKIYILSDKYGLLELEEKIDTYEKDLKGKEAIFKWSENISFKIKDKCNIKTDEFVFLTGKKYYEDLVKLIPDMHYKAPMEGLKNGERLHWLNERINEYEKVKNHIKE